MIDKRKKFVCIGAVHTDNILQFKTKHFNNRTNPVKKTQYLGGVAYNIAEKLSFSVIAPTSALPVTTRAVAVCKRRKILALPDFITTAGPLINDKNLTEETFSSIVDEIIDHDDGPLLGACERAEVFLAKWQSELPFGRPMAS